ncbi:MAG: copper amine oxidase N-terminal domain-containing protein [Armatimonadota bacterium]|nr:copper amine oxidase N-terminal domain-containing protein [Armatimonadota bacterium]MDR7450168.1 copper amine oxidase N-terminal domain-containing protein [Armatimonadota bacterium]MDR7458733.1 copper amine oxidase N-terminal domain-containing protein [Armatimonadota bacterium]MDR7479342.1 copper amine oxidase N-terminal domain-containing protein [Armatimonadota bacterium]MDR7489715.1 copper amine oxidase N-terminal domain-containing protein [Armatimonadota bacterium]
MPHRAVVVILTLLLLGGSLSAPTGAQDAPIRVFVDGGRVRFDQPPVVRGGRVLVPLRGVFERLGASVDWEAATQTVLAVRGGTVVELQIGSRQARVNDRVVLLDVPARIIGARTLVPLRFVSEALGATVQWQEATRTVLIYTGAAAPPPGPAPAPAPAPTAAAMVSGTVVQLRTGDNPVILVDQGTTLVRVAVTPDTAITRVNVATNTGGSVSLNQLRLGDHVEVTLGPRNQALRVRATFRTVVGRLDAVAGGGRTLLLRDGQAYWVADEHLEVLINGREGTVAALRPGMVVTLRLNPQTNLVYGITAETVVGEEPPARPARPVITQPEAGAAISSPVEVRGRAPGAARVVVTLDALLGVRLATGEAQVGPNGGFVVRLTYQPLFAGWPYVITVTAVTPAGIESDAATVQVRQR